MVVFLSETTSPCSPHRYRKLRECNKKQHKSGECKHVFSNANLESKPLLPHYCVKLWPLLLNSGLWDHCLTANWRLYLVMTIRLSHNLYLSHNYMGSILISLFNAMNLFQFLLQNKQCPPSLISGNEKSGKSCISNG